MTTTPKELFMIVACHDHAIQVSDWGDGDLIVTLWETVQSRRYGRLYWAWQALKGHEACGEFVLNAEQALKFRDELDAFAGRPVVYETEDELVDIITEERAKLSEVAQVVDIMSRSPSENAREYAKTLGEILNGDQ